MKFDDLRSVGHNIADSLASGCGLLIGMYEMDIFGEARQSNEGFIEIDFLAGTSSGAPLSSTLQRAIELYRQALPSLCERQGVPHSAFRQLKARYSSDHLLRRFFKVTVAANDGRSAVDEYDGVPGRRIRVLDELGRVRPKPSTRA